ncbi:hypothetical protein E2P81_ATG10204 [Venturia nashicola]|nr:hypothetical protein E2P81_ATG10204 [Venturia nashicola]
MYSVRQYSIASTESHSLELSPSPQYNRTRSNAPRHLISQALDNVPVTIKVCKPVVAHTRDSSDIQAPSTGRASEAYVEGIDLCHVRQMLQRANQRGGITLLDRCIALPANLLQLIVRLLDVMIPLHPDDFDVGDITTDVNE